MNSPISEKEKKVYRNVKAFRLHKLQEDFDSCHDSYDLDTSNDRFAIADGVAKSFESGLWAELLVQKFVADNSFFEQQQPLDEWLGPIREKWFQGIQRDWNKEQFFIKNRRDEPALATFLGLELQEGEGDDIGKLYWRAFIYGDSCLFHFRDQRLIFHGLIESAANFDNFPSAISSKTLKGHKEETKTGLAGQMLAGEAKLGDRFILATDGIAKWILENVEGNTPENLERLFQLKSIDEFDEFVHDCKIGKVGPLMEDDDTTMIQLDFTQTAQALVSQEEDWKSKYRQKERSAASIPLEILNPVAKETPLVLTEVEDTLKPAEEPLAATIEVELVEEIDEVSAPDVLEEEVEIPAEILTVADAEEEGKEETILQEARGGEAKEEEVKAEGETAEIEEEEEEVVMSAEEASIDTEKEQWRAEFHQSAQAFTEKTVSIKTQIEHDIDKCIKELQGDTFEQDKEEEMEEMIGSLIARLNSLKYRIADGLSLMYDHALKEEQKNWDVILESLLLQIRINQGMLSQNVGNWRERSKKKEIDFQETEALLNQKISTLQKTVSFLLIGFVVFVFIGVGLALVFIYYKNKFS